MCGQLGAPSAALYGKTFGTFWTGSWAGPKAGLDVMEKTRISPCRSNPKPLTLLTEVI